MTLSEELQKRMGQKPDQWTLAWIEQRFQDVLKANRGVVHASNCVLAENEDAMKMLAELEKRVVCLEADRAKIGELQARVERMAEFLNKLKEKNVDTTGRKD